MTPTPRAFSSYRPQHDEDCASRPHYDRWGMIAIDPCTCGLDALLAAEGTQPETDHGAELIGQTIPDVAETEPRLNREKR